MWPKLKIRLAQLADAIDGTCQLESGLLFSPETWQSFQQEKGERRTLHFRFSMIAAILLFNSFLALDYFCFPQRFVFCLMIRTGLATPIALACLFLVPRCNLRVREALIAASPLPSMACVLAVYTTPGYIAVGQAALIIMLMYGVQAMWPSLPYAAASVSLVVLGDIFYLVFVSKIDPRRIPVFAALIVTAGLLCLLTTFWIERQERLSYLLRLRVEAQNTELFELTMSDPLTGIPNRRFLDNELKSLWRKSLRKQQSIAVLMIDLDRFKELNDLHGHEFGDRALALVASALRDSLRDEQDLVARYGGEEFVALLPKRTLAGALPIAERIRAAVHEVVLPRPSDGSPVRITTSVGVAAAVPSPSNSALGLLRAADAALYEAKANGRDCVYPLPDHQPGPLSAAR